MQTYTPTLKVKRNGVPILSKIDIDTIGENFVRDFQPNALVTPAPIDIDSFVELYLEMIPDYQYLSHNGIYLGMTVFNDTNAVPIYDPNTKRAEYISAKARTVIIDNRLLAENQRHRYRFTLGHEAGHDILHSAFFAYNPDQMNMFDTPTPPMIQCRVDAGKASNKNLTQWDDHDWMEWQANRLSSAILMPKSAVMKIVSKFKGDPKMLSGAIKLTKRISETFDMSDESALYRLKSLGVIPDTKATATPQIMLLEDFFG